MADANIPYHCHTECPQVGHVLGDATVILITRQEVHTHHQVADVHTRITRIHFPYTRHTGHPHSHAPWVGVRSLSQTDRKSTRLNSSHVSISYAVFCLKKKK